MHKIEYTIETLSPIIISMLSGDRNMIASRSYIPGSVILGMLAAAQLRQSGAGPGEAHRTTDFYDLFLNGDVHFSNSYITVEDEYGSQPTPLSLVLEKNQSPVEVFDLLFPNDVEHPRKLGGFSSFTEGLTVCPVEMQIRFHHSRDRSRGVSKEGQIFNYESITAGQLFTGDILGKQEDLEKIRKICQSLDIVFLGRSRTAEYGKARFSIGEIEELPDQKEYQLHENNADESQVFSLTLSSDLILYNEYGFPTTDVTVLKQALEKALGSKITILEAFVQQDNIETFVGIWRLKKPSETCFSAGSTFLLKAASVVPPDKLTALENKGLGMRKNEGFGRLLFCRQTKDKMIAREVESSEAPQRPTGAPPELTKKILRTIVRNILMERVVLLARTKLETFNHFPSPSLCSKLRVMAANSSSQNDLAFTINRLRKIALNQLRRCVSDEYNLLEYLVSFELPPDIKEDFAKYGLDSDILNTLGKPSPGTVVVLLADLNKKNDISNETLRTITQKLLSEVTLKHEPVQPLYAYVKGQRKYQKFEDLCGEAAYKPEEDEQLHALLVSAFFDSFFSLMRKEQIIILQEE